MFAKIAKRSLCFDAPSDLQVLTHLLARDASGIAGHDHDPQVQRIHGADHAARPPRATSAAADGRASRSTGNFARGTEVLGNDERGRAACTRGCSEAGRQADDRPGPAAARRLREADRHRAPSSAAVTRATVRVMEGIVTESVAVGR